MPNDVVTNNENAEHGHHHDPAEHINKLKQAPRPIVMNEEVTFAFKKPRKDPKTGKAATDELGQEIPARPAIKLTLPLPTLDGIVEALAGDSADAKTQEYIIGLVKDDIIRTARSQIDASDENIPFNQSSLKIEELTIDHLAHMERAERAGRGIAKEVWEEWVKDYVEVMVPVTGKDAEKVGNAASIFRARLQPAKANKKVLAFLQTQLDLWAGNTQNAEEFASVYEFLKKKVDEFLAMDEQQLLANL